jgi:hypothetical protein
MLNSRSRFLGFVGALLALTAQCTGVLAAEAPGELSATPRLQRREALVFRNGDLLYGALESIRPEAGIRWRHSDVEQVIEFAPENVSEIHFPTTRKQVQVSPSVCRVQLINRDELEGAIVGFDETNAVLQTWYAGEITLPRNRIQLITPVPAEGATVFQGPVGLEGWTIGKVVSALGDAGEWKYKNGAFYATNAASIARKLSLPDGANIEFDLAWKGMFQLAIAIYTDYLQPINLANKDTEPEFGGFYSLQLNSFSANLLPVKKNDPLRYLGQISVPAFNQKNAAHVEIRASKPKKVVALYVDGQLLKQWVDAEEFAGQGTGVRFVHQGQGKVKLSNLRVSEWDGQFEEKPGPAIGGKQDIAKLRNGDKVSGHVELIQDGKLTVSSGTTRLVIPLTRVKQIELAGQPVDPSAPPSANVRAVFQRGGAVSFHLETWDQDKILGSSSNFGKLTFDASAFASVELNLKSSAP